MAEGVIEGAEGAGEHQLAGAAAERFVHGQFTVGHILAHRVGHDVHARVAQAGEVALGERVEVADDDVRPQSLLQQKPGAAVGCHHQVGGAGQPPVVAGVLVLAVEEDGGAARRTARLRHDVSHVPGPPITRSVRSGRGPGTRRRTP